MPKSSALPAAFWVGPVDLSGDIGALSSLDATVANQDITGIDKLGTERLQLRDDGSIEYTAFWNPSAGRSVPILSDLTSVTTQCTFVANVGLGAYAASLMAQKVKFTTALGQDGSLVANGQAMESAGTPIEWGRLLTAGKASLTATLDPDAWEDVHDYALNDLVQPTTPNGHYYKVTTDGGSSGALEPTWPTNGTTVVDDGITWTDQGLLPNGLDLGAGSASDFGGAAYLHVFAIASGTANLKLQDSADRIAWADLPAGRVHPEPWRADTVYALNDLVEPTTPNGHTYKATTGGTSDDTTEPTFPTDGSTVADGPDTLVWTDQGLHRFTPVTAAGTERVTMHLDENVRRYVRLYISGTFTGLVAAVSFSRYLRDHTLA